MGVKRASYMMLSLQEGEWLAVLWLAHWVSEQNHDDLQLCLEKKKEVLTLQNSVKCKQYSA